MSNCKACDGTGWVEQGEAFCAVCDGTGSDGRKWPHSSSRCPECGIKQGDLLVPDLQPCRLSSEIAGLRASLESIVKAGGDEAWWECVEIARRALEGKP